MAEILIRPAVLADAPTLAHIQTQAWTSAFGDILAPEALAQATKLEEAQAMYRFVLEHQLAHVSIQFVDGHPQGLTAWSINRDDLGPDTAELICIHSLPQFWGHGYGSHMMRSVLQEVRSAGYAQLALWVFERNQRARAFYEKHGFHLTHQEKETLGAKEVMYAISL